MGTSTTSVNSALARTRRIIAEKVPARTQQQTLRTIDDARVRELVTGFATALERGDADVRQPALTSSIGGPGTACDRADRAQMSRNAESALVAGALRERAAAR